MEHLNYDEIIYQTVHSYYTLELKGSESPVSSSTSKFSVDEFNVFGLEWYPNRLVFTLNGAETFTYVKIEDADALKWPFDQPFFILIDQQLGGKWVGNINADDLPVQMIIDYVKVYQK
jgi:beta-glucanase (GH16 family)